MFLSLSLSLSLSHTHTNTSKFALLMWGPFFMCPNNSYIKRGAFLFYLSLTHTLSLSLSYTPSLSLHHSNYSFLLLHKVLGRFYNIFDCSMRGNERRFLSFFKVKYNLSGWCRYPSIGHWSKGNSGYWTSRLTVHANLQTMSYYYVQILIVLLLHLKHLYNNKQ